METEAGAACSAVASRRRPASMSRCCNAIDEAEAEREDSNTAGMAIATSLCWAKPTELVPLLLCDKTHATSLGSHDVDLQVRHVSVTMASSEALNKLWVADIRRQWWRWAEHATGEHAHRQPTLLHHWHKPRPEVTTPLPLHTAQWLSTLGCSAARPRAGIVARAPQTLVEIPEL
mmetsp:Transcript_126231/g.318665  ORF Transcript_126231/g.318665 Transcript_126231/m.318665 type:complete len:175 (+) Transcript_126231:511-1035(+)